LLCSKGDKDDEQKKKDSGKSAGPVAKSPKAFNNYGNWDLEQANVIADVLAIARQERVAIAKEDKENKKKLLKDMKEFYVGKVEEEEFYAFKAEEPEEDPEVKKRKDMKVLAVLKHKFFKMRDVIKTSHPHIIDRFDSCRDREQENKIIEHCFRKTEDNKWKMSLELPYFKESKTRCVWAPWEPV
jgi:hypothetical protein